MSAETHIEHARKRLRERTRARAERCEEMRQQAVRDTQAIVRMVVQRYAPIRIYQWGSVLRSGGFREYSDLDIAVEGVCDPQAFFRLLREAQEITRLPLDLVPIEKIAPEYAEGIRQHGKVLYERD